MKSNDQTQTYSGHETKKAAETNLTSAKKNAYKKISTTQKYIIRVQGHILYFTMCRNTAHGRHIIYVLCVCVVFFLSRISLLFTGVRIKHSAGSVRSFGVVGTFIRRLLYLAYALAFKFSRFFLSHTKLSAPAYVAICVAPCVVALSCFFVRTHA